MGLYLARTGGAEITGVTLSREQLAVSQRRVAEAGLDQSVDFRLQDYRTLTGRFDRIVSVGMFEHVGVPHYPRFFQKVSELLADDGRSEEHTSELQSIMRISYAVFCLKKK